MDFSTMNIWCWLIPIIIGLLCAYFGYLLGKGKSTTIDNSADLKLLKDKNAKLQTDLDACKGKLSAGTAKAGVSSKTAPSSSLTAAETGVAFNAAAAKAALGKTVKQDDLKIVEGIGPKISEMFSATGIKTWKALSDISVAECQKVLDGGGNRYKVHDPASWPMQAKMAYEGKWAELAKWQDEHNHGKL
ncbi:MAG: hypothetical protein KJO63_12270 [Maribacter sp.]|nr:hypothetical protein [Maribacter sp.]